MMNDQTIKALNGPLPDKDATKTTSDSTSDSGETIGPLPDKDARTGPLTDNDASKTTSDSTSDSGENGPLPVKDALIGPLPDKDATKTTSGSTPDSGEKNGPLPVKDANFNDPLDTDKSPETSTLYSDLTDIEVLMGMQHDPLDNAILFPTNEFDKPLGQIEDCYCDDVLEYTRKRRAALTSDAVQPKKMCARCPDFSFLNLSASPKGRNYTGLIRPGVVERIWFRPCKCLYCRGTLEEDKDVDCPLRNDEYINPIDAVRLDDLVLQLSSFSFSQKREILKQNNRIAPFREDMVTPHSTSEAVSQSPNMLNSTVDSSKTGQNNTAPTPVKPESSPRHADILEGFPWVDRDLEFDNPSMILCDTMSTRSSASYKSFSRGSSVVSSSSYFSAIDDEIPDRQVLHGEIEQMALPGTEPTTPAKPTPSNTDQEAKCAQKNTALYSSSVRPSLAQANDFIGFYNAMPSFSSPSDDAATALQKSQTHTPSRTSSSTSVSKPRSNQKENSTDKSSTASSRSTSSVMYTARSPSPPVVPVPPLVPVLPLAPAVVPPVVPPPAAVAPVAAAPVAAAPVAAAEMTLRAAISDDLDVILDKLEEMAEDDFIRTVEALDVVAKFQRVRSTLRRLLRETTTSKPFRLIEKGYEKAAYQLEKAEAIFNRLAKVKNN